MKLRTEINQKMFPRWELYKIHDVIHYARNILDGYDEEEERIEEIGSIDINKCLRYVKNENDVHEPKKYGIPVKIIRGGEQWNHGEEPDDPLLQSVNRFLGKLHRISLQLRVEPHKRTLLFDMYGSAVPVGALTMKSMKSFVSLKGDNFQIGSDFCEGILTCAFKYQDTNNLKARIPIRFYLLCDTVLYLETEYCYFVYTIELKCTISQEFWGVLRTSYLEEDKPLKKTNRPKFEMQIDIKMEEEEPQLDENVKVEPEAQVKEEPENEEILKPEYIGKDEEGRRGKFQMIIDVKMEEEEPRLDEEVHPEPVPFEQDKPRKRKFKPVPVQVKEEEEDESVEREIKMEENDPPVEREIEMQKNLFVQPKSWKELYDNLKNALFEFEDGIEHKKQYNFTIQFKGESLERRHAPGLRYIMMNIRYDGMLVSVERINYEKIYPLNDLRVKRYEICTKNAHPEREGFTIYSEIYKGRLYVFMYLEGDKYRISV